MAESSKGLGLAALVSRSIPSVQFSLGRRSQKPATGIQDKVNKVANAIRPGTVTNIYSGQEPKGIAPVGAPNRHPRGFAGDFRFYDETTGQQILDREFFKELSITMAEQYNANIGYSEVGYMGAGSIHIDTMPLDVFGGGSVWGQTALSWAKDLAAARQKAKVPKDQVFDIAAMTREQALSEQAQEGAIAEAFNSPSRGFDVTTPPSALAAQYAQYERSGVPAPANAQALASQYSQYQRGTVPAAPRPSAPPSNFSVPARPSPIGSAPVGQVTRAPLGPALSRPTPPSNFAGGTTPAALNAAPAGTVTREALGPAISRPSAPPSNFAKGTMPTAPAKAAGTPTAGYDTKAPSTEKLAANYGQYRTPTNYTNVQKAMQAQPMSVEDQKLAAAYTQYGLTKALAPTAPVTAPPATVATAAVPAIAPPTVIAPPPPVYQPRPAHQVAPVAMRPTPPATAYDVYSGLADTAMDNTGQNRVSSIPGGTTVTNRHGATTGMMNGYQTAVGSMPSIPGMSMPSKSTVGGAVKGGALGLGVAGPVGGLVGALLGGALASEMAKKNGTAAATTGQSGGGLSGFLGSLFGGNNTASKSGASSSKSSGTSSKSSSVGSYGASGSGSYGSNPNSKSPRI